MIIQLQEYGVIKTQQLEIQKENVLIYGYNNSGKTSLLKEIDNVCNKKLIESMFKGEVEKLSLYIPTNRIVVNSVLTEKKLFNDIEDFVNYKKDMYENYSLHLKMLRDELLQYDFVCDIIINAIKKMFGLLHKNFSIRASDGIENIINIYLNIIWALIWNKDRDSLTDDLFGTYLNETEIIVLIDEIEIFLHVSVQAKLLTCLNESFPKCKFIMTTHSPLLLSRNKKIQIFELNDGILNSVQNDFYYKDLDKIVELSFGVSEIPVEVKSYVNYLGDVLMGEETIDKDKIQQYIFDLENTYPNLYKKYQVLISKIRNLIEE